MVLDRMVGCEYVSEIVSRRDLKTNRIVPVKTNKPPKFAARSSALDVGARISRAKKAGPMGLVNGGL